MTRPGIPAIVPYADLNITKDNRINPGGGQSDGIYRIPGHTNLLFKRYKTPAAVNRFWLDRLVAQPDMLADVADRRLAQDCTAWPCSRVVDGDATVGVVLPEAPDSMRVAILMRGAYADETSREYLEIDLLAMDNAYLAARGLREQSDADRLTVCHQLARIGRLFERYRIVYADWSYANAFWHPEDHRLFLLDIDGCSYGPRGHVATPNFEEPGMPASHDVDTYTDRYRLALLIGRCLTARRHPDDVADELRSWHDPLPQVLLAMLTEPDRTARPSLTRLAELFDAATGVEQPTVVLRAPEGSGVAGLVAAPSRSTPPPWADRQVGRLTHSTTASRKSMPDSAVVDAAVPAAQRRSTRSSYTDTPTSTSAAVTTAGEAKATNAARPAPASDREPQGMSLIPAIGCLAVLVVVLLVVTLGVLYLIN